MPVAEPSPGSDERGLDRLLPAWLDGASPEARRRAKVVVLFSLSLASFGPPNGLLFWWLGLPIGALTCAIGVGTVLATIAVLHRTRSTSVAGHWLAAQMYFIVLFCATEVGGLNSSALAWLGAVPVFAIMVAGRRAGVVWLGMVALQVGGFALAERGGWLAVSGLSETTTLWYNLVILTGAAALQMLLGWWYEGEKRNALSAVERAAGAARAAHEASRLILDNVSDGLVMIDERGALGSQRSAQVDAWFGAPAKGSDVCGWLEGVDPGFAEALRFGLEQLAEDWMPFELAIAQLPNSLRRDGRVFEVTYEPLRTAVGTGLLVRFTDISEQVEAERARRARVDLATLLERFGRDPQGTRAFIHESTQLVGLLVRASRDGGGLELPRVVHTLKGNAGIFGLEALAETCHDAETRLAEGVELETALGPILAAWEALHGVVAPLVGADANAISVDRDTVLSWRATLAATGAAPNVARGLDACLTEATSERLERLGEAASAVARRLGKGEVEITTDGGDIRVDPVAWRDLWPALVHVIRNALDHGVESAEERSASGKAGAGTVRLSTRREGAAVVLEVVDDGRGIDWSAVAASAARRDLPCESQKDLEAALFTDGLSTKGEVSAISGRGVGLAAVRSAVYELGGSIEIDSARGRGTTFRFVVPDATNTQVAA